MSFFVQAHQDDWQLCMASTADGRGAYSDLCGSPVTFVFTTAGDAGRGASWWTAREEGTKASAAHMIRNFVDQSAQWTDSTRTYNQHVIPVSAISNATCVFMRLPDGNVDGNGFQSTGWESLEKLYESDSPVTSVDDRHDTYPTWSDLVATLAAIIEQESVTHGSVVWINAIGLAEPGHVAHATTWNAISAAASAAKDPLQRREQALNSAAWLGTGRPIPPNPPDPGPGDARHPNRIALLYPYEMRMLEYSPDGQSCSLAEYVPLFASWLAAQQDPILAEV